MARDRLDLDAVDAALDRLETTGNPGSVGESAAARDGCPDELGGQGLSRRAVRLHHPELVQQAVELVRPRRRSVKRSGRPSSLPDPVVPPGYMLDGRFTWRYRHDGRRVPSARHLTLSNLWPFGAADPVSVPDRLCRLCPELAWCRTFGVVALERTTGTLVWQVDLCDWLDHDGHTLGLDAPELAPHRLVTVEQAALWLDVSVSTVTSQLARGRLPEPQVRLAGRPAWSAPILVAYLSAGPRPVGQPRRRLL